MMPFQRLAAVVLAAGMAVPLSAFRETRINQRTAGMADAVVQAMNRERIAYGLRPLRIDDRLSLAAEDRIDDMFSKHYFNHVAHDGTQPWTWADREGYRYHEMGENLAVGYKTPGSIVDGWMNSPGHRANILRKDFVDVGVAIAPGSPTRRFEGPTVVALYGER